MSFKSGFESRDLHGDKKQQHDQQGCCSVSTLHAKVHQKRGVSAANRTIIAASALKRSSCKMTAGGGGTRHLQDWPLENLCWT